MTPTRAWTTALLLLLGSPVLAACGARTDASGAPLAEPDDGPVRFPSGTIAVADGLGASFYPPDAVTGTPALGHLSWPADGFVRQYLAFDGSGNLYAAAYLDGNATSKPVARVDVFAAGSVGQSQAVRAIVGPTTGLLSARGILVDSTGFVYVSNGDVTGATSGVDVFAPDASGDVGPVRSIRSSAAAFWLPSGIAMNATGDALYVGNSEPGPVYVFAAADGTQAPLGSLGDTALLGDVTGVAVDSSGRIYAADWSGSRVAVFGPGGNSGAIGFIGGAATGINQPLDVAVDHAGRIWVANGEAGAIAFAPATLGSAAPVAVLGPIPAYNLAVAP